MNTKVMHEVMTETQAGKLTFPEVVRRLVEAGVESYFVDLATRNETFYLSDGRTHAETMTLPIDPVNKEFSPSHVIAAIRGAQADAIRYPEFMKRAAAAGVIAYWAFLAGRKVVYFGRKGEMHIEDFPPANSSPSLPPENWPPWNRPNPRASITAIAIAPNPAIPTSKGLRSSKSPTWAHQLRSHTKA
jgi:uncharacterized protein YbcV (DUF1398 family)